MQIGGIAPPWVRVPSPAYGGTEAIVDRLARGFAKAGHDVCLFATGDSTCPVRLFWHFEESQGDAIGDPQVERAHTEAAYEALSDCDVIHDHTVSAAWHAPQQPESRVVITLHGPVDEELRDQLTDLPENVRAVGISRSQLSVWPALSPVSVVHHGIDTDSFSLGAGQGGYLLFLGRMAPEKGAHRAAEVARLAGLPLKIAAKMREPAERSFFRGQVAPRLGDGVEYVGEVDHVERAELLGDAVALINPIRWMEPFGLVMVEALACGTPVLSFPEGSASEIISDGVTGYLCDSEGELAAAASKVGELSRGKCRQVAEERFSSARMVSEYLQILVSMCETPLRPQMVGGLGGVLQGSVP